MKRVFCVTIMVLMAFTVGCSPSEKKEDSPPAPKAPVAETPATIPQQPPESAREVVEGYQKGLEGSVDKARMAQAREDLGAIKTVVQSYYADNMKYPASLDDVKSGLRAGIDLSLFNYDPATGDVRIK